MTEALPDKEKVLAKCPDANAIFHRTGYGPWQIYTKINWAFPIGIGDTEDEAWADAAISGSAT